MQTRLTVPSAMTLAKLVTAVAWIWLLSHEALPAVGHVTQGFAAYYAAAYAVIHSGASDLNNDAAFATWLVRAGIHVGEVFQGNAPTLSLLMIPLLVVSPETAQTLWLAANLVMLTACVWLAGQLCAPDNQLTRWCIAAVFPLLNPVRETIHWGQVYILLALLSLVAVRALVQRRHMTAGISVGLAMLIKPYYGILALALLIWSRRWRASLATGATAILIAVVSLPLLAPAWADFVHSEFVINDVGWSIIPANQTLNSLVQHLFIYSSEWNPAPLAVIPWLAEALRWALMIGPVAITLRAAVGRNPLWLWLPTLVLMPVFAPVGEPHHMMCLLLPVAVSVSRLVDYFRPSAAMTNSIFSNGRISRGVMLLLVAALLLLVLPWPSVRDNSLWNGWWALLAYPRLCGALLLWGGIMLSSPKVEIMDRKSSKVRTTEEFA